MHEMILIIRSHVPLREDIWGVWSVGRFFSPGALMKRFINLYNKALPTGKQVQLWASLSLQSWKVIV